MVARSSSRAPSLALIALSAWSWISAVSADIRFANVPGPIDPGTPLLLAWKLQPANTTGADTLPFSLQLRAETGQRYIISNDVPQNLMQYNVNIPKEATGGKVSDTTSCCVTLLQNKSPLLLLTQLHCFFFG